MPPARRIAFASAVALCVGLSAVVCFSGWSADPVVKAVETLAVVGAVAAVVFGGFVLIGLRVGDYREPQSEADFQQGGLRAERLAREGLAVEPNEAEFMDLDPYDDTDFEELVRDALDELPDLL